VARLPTPGGDENTWGSVLNDFLAQSLNTDGTLKKAAIEATAPAASAITFSAGGTISATNAQTAISEVATDAASALSTHAADATIHSSGREIAYAEVTTNQTGITTTLSLTDITGLSITIPPGGVRPVYVLARLQVTNTTANTQAAVAITTNGFNEIVAAGYVTVNAISRAESVTAEVRLPPGTSGTYKVGMLVSGGSASTVTSASAPSIVCYIKAIEA
jgi:hypothetical protein